MHDLDLFNIDFRALPTMNGPVVLLSNAGTPVVDAINQHLSDYRGVRVLRDPRQLLVSNYFHHLNGHNVESPAGWVWDRLKAHRARLQASDLEHGLLLELESITADLMENQIIPWRPDPRVLEYKIEEFRPVGSDFDRLGEHLQLEVTISVDVSRKFGNPQAASWPDVMTKKVKDAFKARWGEALIDLGYAQDKAW